LISEVLTLLSVISASVGLLARSMTMIRFAVAFLGLFSSLAAYVQGGTTTGLVLLLSSSVLLPYPISRLHGDAEMAKRPLGSGPFVVIIGTAVALAVPVLIHSGAMEGELAILACIGLVALIIRKSSLSVILGSVFVTQAVLVTLSIGNVPLCFISLTELCRLACIRYFYLFYKKN